MAELVIPNAALVTLYWSFGGIQGRNVLGAVAGAPIPVDQTLANTLATGARSAFTSSGYGALAYAGTVLNTVGIRDINTPNKAEFLGTGTGVSGTSAGDHLPRQNAVVVTLRTAGAGQSFRGRVYLGGWTEDANATDASITAGAQTAAAAFVTALQSLMASSGMTLAVLSRPQDGSDAITVVTPAKPPKAGFGTAVTLIQVRDGLWDSQRRRIT